MDLYLLKNYNNYFNRTVKYLDNLGDYLETVGQGNYFILQDTNFNPNDGVSANHVFGSALHPFNKDWQPDYCLVVETLAGGIKHIVSRWYVIEFVRQMANQYSCNLKRDTIADKYISTINSSCFIQKATLLEDDPMIVNNEGIQFNQIKTREYFLRDNSKVPWLVLYLKQKREGTEHENPDDQSSELGYEIKSTYVNPSTEPATPLDTDPAGQIFLRGGNFRSRVRIKIYLYANGQFEARMHIAGQGIWSSFWWGWENPHDFWWEANGNKPMSAVAPAKPNFDEWHTGVGFPTANSVELSAFQVLREMHENSEVKSKFNNLIDHTGDNYNDVDRFVPNVIEGKLYTYAGVNYKAKIVPVSNERYNIPQNQLGEIAEIYRSRWNELKPKPDGGSWQDGTNAGFSMNCIVRNYDYILEEIPLGQVRGFIRNDNMRHIVDVPFDILAFPLNEIDVYNNTTKQFTSNPLIPINFAREVIKKLGDFSIDAQILPFAPNYDMNIITDSGEIQINGYTNQFDYIILKDTSSQANKAIGFFAHSSVNTFDISTLSESIWDKENILPMSTVLTVQDRKIESNCDLWRLCSPNFASQFEFNLAKCITVDRPYISKFNVDITYRPFNPYIKLNPEFGFLYGRDYDDARGLICSGDFGITTLSSAWTQFENSNKNYQNIFDRRIKNMETNRQIGREQDEWNITKAWAGFGMAYGGTAIGGAIAGMINPLVGVGAGLAGIGRIAGAGMNVASAYKQRDWNERAYNEMRSFETDMFNMQMDNIKAMPDTITHSSSLSNNFKFFPVLEYYTCTEIEKEALKNKIRMNGMTVGRIDKISNYLDNDEERFIKGEIIRIYDLGEDAHLAQDIYNEVNKGLFFFPIQNLLDQHLAEVNNDEQE